MCYMINNSESFEVSKFASLAEMTDLVCPTAFMKFAGMPEDYICVEDPTPEQEKVLSLAMEMMEISLYFPEQLAMDGYTIRKGTEGDYAYKDYMSPTYNVLRCGRLMDQKVHMATMEKLIKLPSLGELCNDDEFSHDFIVFKRMMTAMLDFVELGYVQKTPVMNGDDSDIPF